MDERTRDVLKAAGFKNIPQEATDVTILGMQSGRHELKLTLSDDNGVRVIQESIDPKLNFGSASKRINTLKDGGIPEIQIEGKTFI